MAHGSLTGAPAMRREGVPVADRYNQTTGKLKRASTLLDVVGVKPYEAILHGRGLTVFGSIGEVDNDDA